MKEDILRLRAQGKSYREIEKTLGCSKSTISYHCSDGQKEKNRQRTIKRRGNILKRKTDTFRYIKYEKPLKENKDKRTEKEFKEVIRKFNKKEKGKVNPSLEMRFTWKDVLEEYGEDTHCYLSGEKINLFENNYQLDHKVPVSKGGTNDFSNLGITHEVVNRMKGALTVEEFIDWCVRILKFQGYKIER